jgi:peptidoglycan/LPS O-acetylase OafA/YrhL
MLTPKKRLRELDILRATAIFLVVLFHLPFDLNSPLAEAPAFAYMVLLGMALFFFLSGFAIDLNNKGIATRADLGTFFRKRATRIFPLYWVATASSILALLIVLSVLHTSLSDVVQYGLIEQKTYDLSLGGIVLSFLGAQVLLGPRFINVPNRWFVGTILVCYLLYPVIAYFGKDDVRRILLVSAALVLCLLAARVTFNVVGDDRLYIYFGFFVGGIIVRRINLFYTGAAKKRVAASFLLIVPVIILAQLAQGFSRESAVTVGLGLNMSYTINEVASVIFQSAVGFLFVIAVFYVAKAWAPRLSTRAARFFFFAATASYAVFLFHQQFLVGLRFFLERAPHLGGAEVAFIVIVIGLPVLFTVAFYEQRAEPRAVKRIIDYVSSGSLWNRIWRF